VISPTISILPMPPSGLAGCLRGIVTFVTMLLDEDVDMDVSSSYGRRSSSYLHIDILRQGWGRCVSGGKADQREPRR
jgi:hypothetical protein